jgi:hypothetical protein
MSAAAKILDRLELVKQTAPGRWIARCPSHADRSPSLSVRELDTGAVLLHDFGGCPVGDVLAAIGMTLADLYERPLGERAVSHSRIPPRDLLALIDHEALVVGLIAAQFRETRELGENDWQRLAMAVSRIGKARDHGCA